MRISTHPLDAAPHNGRSTRSGAPTQLPRQRRTFPPSPDAQGLVQRLRGSRHATRARAIALAGVIALGAMTGSTRVEPARAGAEALPDLAMAPLQDFQIQWVNGRRLLRFTAMMVNIGPGHFEVRGSRGSTGQPMVMRQVIFADTSHTNVSRQVVTDAEAKYAGDGHNHWHVQEMMRYDLWGGDGTFRGAKVGFCFLDSDVADSTRPGYSGGFYVGSFCSTNPSALSNKMGISIGMGDEYEWYLAWQWIDITGLSAGTYTLRSKVDPWGYFEESQEGNQCAYAKVSFGSSSNAVNLHERARGCPNDWSTTIFASHIAWMFEANITGGCGPELFCTNNPISRGEMAAFLDRALGLPGATVDHYDDDDGSLFESSINSVAEANITGGCGPRRFCPHADVTRGAMVAFLDRALDLPSTTSDFFTDDSRSIFEGNINRAAAAGIAGGCAASRFCPTRQVTRGQVAAFLDRALND